MWINRSCAFALITSSIANEVLDFDHWLIRMRRISDNPPADAIN